MSLLDLWIAKIKSAAGRTLVLAEGHDPRVMQAAAKVASLGIARKVSVLATPEEQAAAGQGVCFDGLNVEFLDYLHSAVTERLAAAFYERRKAKGVTLEQARLQMANRIYFGDMLVREGLADALVAGSIATTPDMVRAAFQCIGTAPGIKTGSSFFAMELAQPTTGGESVLFYADAGVNPDPTPEQLMDIAVSTIHSYQALVGGQARVAMLSFSTKGSAKHALVDKMVEATRLAAARVQELKLDALVDGELQIDAALVPAVAAGREEEPAVAEPVAKSESPPEPEVTMRHDRAPAAPAEVEVRRDPDPVAAADDPPPELASAPVKERILFGESDDLLADVDSGVNENEFKW